MVELAIISIGFVGRIKKIVQRFSSFFSVCARATILPQCKKMCIDDGKECEEDGSGR